VSASDRAVNESKLVKSGQLVNGVVNFGQILIKTAKTVK